MQNKVIELPLPGTSGERRTARISVGLRNLSRECRHDILRSFGYQSMLHGALSREQYIGLLRAHFDIHHTLETLFASLNGVFAVSNTATGDHKRFELRTYVTESRSKSAMLDSDLLDLTGISALQGPRSRQAQPLVSYMTKVRDVYSAALLGVLYMLEETVTYAGPRVGAALDAQLRLAGRGTSYLSGASDQKANFRRFRKSLDLIRDFQTQVNIVTASTITYRLYRELLSLRSGTSIHGSGRLH